VDVEKSTKLKDEGNILFNNGKFAEALSLYEEAISYNRKAEKTAAIFTNKAACLIKLGKFHEALQAAQSAKSLDPRWIKAYLREAQAYGELNEFGDSAASYFEALKLDSSNKDIKNMFDQMVEQGKIHHQKQKNEKK